MCGLVAGEVAWMGVLFKDELQDAFGTWALGYIPFGGADYGEVQAVARTVGDGDNTAFYDAWIKAGDRLAESARGALQSGKKTTARDGFLRASCHYTMPGRLLYGIPLDERVLAAFRKQIAALNEGLALGDPPVVPLRIPFGDISLPAYFLPAERHANDVRPLVIFTNGYDATVTDMYFASAVATSRRGYHCLFFDGPGQGEMLFEHGVHHRPDWESVITPVVDFALQFQEVDPDRIVLMGWSLGGYLAARAASAEHRLAACIADPGLFSVADGMRQTLEKLGAPRESLRDLGNADEAVLRRIEDIEKQSPHFYWSIVQRGYLVHGVDNLRSYLRAIEDYTLEGRVDSITCPTLVTAAENDPLAAGAEAFFNTLRCPKTLLRFTAAEGADTHVESFNRSLLNNRVYDWLDEVLEVPIDSSMRTASV
jgi:alpha-beta hydrolase superfamily lysophospholipase